MTKTKLIFIGLALALVGFLFAGSASAQDGQSLTADPSVVAEAGDYQVAISGSGYTAGASRNVAVCSTAEDGAISGAAGLMQFCGGFGDTITIGDDGTYSATLDVTVTEDGVTILLFELAEDGEAASATVVIGEVMEDDMLAETGVETSVLVIIGAGIALAGLMVFGLSRRMRTL